MPIVNNSKIFLDTNVLIYQTFEDFDVTKHLLVTNNFEQLRHSNHTFYISSQIIREFVAIATNGTIFKSPLQSDDIVLKINEFEKSFTVLFDTFESLQILKQLIQQYHVEKYKVHDANIAAMVIANQIDYLWTFNEKDFKVFDKIHLLQISKP
jgi:predicted nucleic acid-binding protein